MFAWKMAVKLQCMLRFAIHSSKLLFANNTEMIMFICVLREHWIIAPMLLDQVTVLCF